MQRTTHGPVACSRTTALLLHGMSGVQTSPAHVTRLDSGAHRRQPDDVHHVGRVAADEIERVDGLLVSVPSRAVIEAGTILGLESSLVCADSVLHHKRCSAEELHRMSERCESWPGSQRIHLTLRHLGPGETPGDAVFRERRREDLAPPRTGCLRCEGSL